MHFTPCRLWNAHGQVLRSKWDLSLGFGNMGDELFQGKNEHEWPFGFFFKYNTWRKGCTRKCHVLFLWPIKFSRKMSIVLVWSTRWEQLNSWASPHILMPNYANYNKPTTLHLEHVNFSIFLITCMQNIPYKLKSPFVKLNDLCEHKGHFYMNI